MFVSYSSPNVFHENENYNGGPKSDQKDLPFWPCTIVFPNITLCHLVNNHLVEAESPLTSMPGFLESVYLHIYAILPLNQQSPRSFMYFCIFEPSIPS